MIYFKIVNFLNFIIVYVVFKASNTVIELFSYRYIEGVVTGFKKRLMIYPILNRYQTFLLQIMVAI
ncbi:MAG: hypothetical protein ACTSP9_14000 [Promethearchaeota archaeon]